MSISIAVLLRRRRSKALANAEPGERARRRSDASRAGRGFCRHSGQLRRAVVTRLGPCAQRVPSDSDATRGASTQPAPAARSIAKTTTPVTDT
jgi:hypothetical protein